MRACSTAARLQLSRVSILEEQPDNNADGTYARGQLTLEGHLYFLLIRKREASISLFKFLFFFHEQRTQGIKLPIDFDQVAH